MGQDESKSFCIKPHCSRALLLTFEKRNPKIKVFITMPAQSQIIHESCK